jgi:hypothetical protein
MDGLPAALDQPEVGSYHAQGPWEMIYFILEDVAYRHLKKYHFVVVNLHGDRARWKTGDFFIMESYDGTYSYFRILRDEKSGKSVPVKAVHRAILVLNKKDNPSVFCHQVYSCIDIEDDN